MVDHPLVSIVIPVFERVNLVQKAISSAINQTYNNIEVVVGDNNSSDGTFKLLKEINNKSIKIKVFKNNKNIGPVNNWIKCINKTNGDYIKLLFSDDWLEPNYLEETMPMFTKSTGFVYTPTVIHNIIKGKQVLSYNTYKRSVKILTKNSIRYFLTSYKTPVSPGGGVFRKKDILYALNMIIDEKDHPNYLKYGAGLDLLVYLFTLDKYPEVAFVNTTCSHFLWHKDSFTSSNSLAKYYKNSKLFYLERNTLIKRKLWYQILIIFYLDRIIAFISNKYFEII